MMPPKKYARAAGRGGFCPAEFFGRPAVAGLSRRFKKFFDAPEIFAVAQEDIFTRGEFLPDPPADRATPSPSVTSSASLRARCCGAKRSCDDAVTGALAP